MILHAIGRLIMVPLGVLLGAGAAMAVLLTLGLEVTTHALSGRAGDADKLEVLVDLGLGLVSLAAAASILPALLMVIVGEVARIRSVLYYVLGGGVSLALLPMLARWGTIGSSGGNLPTRVWAVLATAGFAGGLVYWMIAGRRA